MRRRVEIKPRPEGNNRDDIRVRFTVSMLCEPGKPMLTFVDKEELVRRKDRRDLAEN